MALVHAKDVGGTWKVAFAADWTTIPDLVCTFMQEEQELTGNCADAGGDSVDLIGGANGDEASWQMIVVTPDGRTWT